MEIFKKVLKFFNRKYWLFLGLIIIISYGQLLFMQPWEDDNALFFKLANLEGSAGYLGQGPFGEGAYMYTATPYIPIYTFFGHNTVFYFAFAIFFYFLATLSVYKTFSWILGKRSGQIAGFLYATGYIASDGFIRLFNTIITSISVIGISFFAFFYWQFYRQKNLRWYLLALLTFFMVNELAHTRTHYLVVIVIAFELLFFNKGKNIIISIRNLLLRLIPFLYIFYRYFVVGADARSSNIKTFLEGILKGQFYNLYGWLSGLTSVVIPDWFTNLLFKLQAFLSSTTSINLPYAWLLSSVSLFVFVYIILGSSKNKKLLTVSFSLLITVWAIISKQIFTTPVLNIGEQQIFVGFLGGVLFILGLLIIWIIPKTFKPIFAVFGFWTIVNIGAYSANNPLLIFGSIHRYLAHSFFAFIGILAVFIALLPDKLKGLSKLVFIIIIFWGLGNLVASVSYQNNIVRFRSNPPRDFYRSLKSFLPKIERGDVIYFDVADNAKGYFRDAFSVAQMPEETAIAWRYGIDRYDIRRVTKFDDLVKLITEGSFTDKEKNNVSIHNVYTFFYSSSGLVDTTDDTKKLFEGSSVKQAIFNGQLESKDDLTVSLSKVVKSVVPTEVELTLSAVPLDPKELHFPYSKNDQMAKNNIAKNDEYRKLAFEYKKSLESLRQKLSVKTSNDWKDNIASNLIDGNSDTFWRGDRVLWRSQGAILILDLKQALEVDRFVWINASPSNTPIEYKIETSLDGEHWQDAKEINDLKRIDTKELQVIKFSPRRSRFVRMVITKTLSMDSAGIAEAWVVPTTFSELYVQEAEEFLAEPFGYVPSVESYRSSLSELAFKGRVQVYWISDKSDSWTSAVGREIDVIYDGSLHKYKIVLPAGGTKIDSLKLMVAEIPGTITLIEITSKPLSIKEIKSN